MPSNSEAFKTANKFIHFFKAVNREYDTDFENYDDFQKVVKRVQNFRDSDSKSWQPRRPSSNEHIWRYLNITQLLSILERGEIHFTNVGQFDDPYEGTIPKSNLREEVEKISQEFGVPDEFVLALFTQRDLISFQTNAYVSCWNINEYQSAALWEQYVDTQEGVAIQTTVDRLKDALTVSDYGFTLGSVRYIDYDTETIPSGRLPTIYHKRTSFEHENEFRVSHLSESDDLPDKGFYAEVDEDILIERIVISPLAPDWFSSLIEQLLATYELDCELIESDLYSDPSINIK